MPRNDKDSELVIGLISTVGTDANGVIDGIKRRLSLFRYKVEVINVSEVIISQFEREHRNEWPSEFERISHYMDLGNRIREGTEDYSILMKGVARHIYQSRDKDANGYSQPKKRTAYIIKSLKHPAEVGFMRDTYGDVFHLIGVTSSRERRINYLTDVSGLSEEKAKELLTRDENEDLSQGQHTRDAFQHADYFINLTGSIDNTNNSVSRLIDLLFGDPFITPGFDEYAMFMAYAASLRSADLSRQIGAVIANNNEILAMGANDCPKYGGGLYWPLLDAQGMFEDEPKGRDYKLGYDSNSVEKQNIINSLLTAFQLENTEDNIKKVMSAGIGDLTEYGRVVHGEMEALLACARNNISCRGATLYATTFPCHNCAKHIIAAGITRVVYIEPYPKSKAFLFYDAEISDTERVAGKVTFEPFNGVGPQKFIDLFSMSSSRWYERIRKNKLGHKKEWKRDEVELRNPISLLNYLDAEQSALMVFEEETIALKGGSSHEQ